MFNLKFNGEEGHFEVENQMPGCKYYKLITKAEIEQEGKAVIKIVHEVPKSKGKKDKEKKGKKLSLWGKMTSYFKPMKSKSESVEEKQTL